MTGSLDCETMPTLDTTAGELTLRIVGSEHDGRVIRIQSPKCTIGSSRGATLRLRAPGVRDVHCLVIRGPGGLVVRNWSRETRLNGRQFEDAVLTVGDRLTIGSVQLEILPSGATEGEPAPATGSGRDEQLRLQRLERIAREEKQKREELARQCSQHEQFVSELQAKLTEAESLIAQLRQDTVSDTLREKSIPADAAALAELEELKQQAEELTRQYELARNSFAIERESWQNERSQLQFSVLEVERRIENLTATLTQARDEATAERAAWEAERAALHHDVERLRHANHQHLELNQASAEAKVAVAHWRERYEEQVQLLAECEAKLAALASEQRTASDEEYQKLRAELEADARELDAETERFFAAEAAFEKERAAWRAECDALAETQNARRLELEAQLAALAAERTLNDQLASVVPAANPGVDEEQSRLAAWRDELEQRAAQLRSEQEQLTAERDALRCERERFETQCAAWTPPQAEPATIEPALDPAALAAQRAELLAWQEDLATREQAISEQHERLTVEHEALTQERLEHPIAAPSLDDIQEELNAAREELAQERADLARERAWLEEQRAAWEQERAESQSAPLAPSEPVSHESASDVIARLSASGLWKDQPDEPVEATSHTPEPAWKALVPEVPKPTPQPAHAEDDDSIEAYMQRLLMRVSGDAESSRTRTTTVPVETKPVAAEPVDKAPAIEDKSEHHQPFDFQKFVPRSTAPELMRNMTAMRELANSTARSAIDVSGKLQRRRNAQSKGVFAALALATMVGSYWLSSHYGYPLALLGSLASLIAAIFWGAQSALMWLAIRKQESLEAEDAADNEALACDVVESTSPVETSVAQDN